MVHAGRHHSPIRADMWLEEHGDKFPGSKDVFEANLAEIRAWNADSSNSWKKGVNKVGI